MARNTGGASDGFSRLQKGLTGERSLAGAPYMNDAALLAAYAEYYHPVSLAQADRVRHALATAFPRGFPRLVDFGTGSGAVAESFVRGGTREAYLVDRSEPALARAASRLSSVSGDVGVRTATRDLRGLSGPGCFAASAFPGDLSGWADCVTFGHALNELWEDRDDRAELRANLVESVRFLLAPGGIAVVMEPALTRTSRDLIAMRDILVARGWTVLAPCPGRSRLPCPALSAGPAQTCHEVIPWVAPPAVARRAVEMGLEKDALKMAWFAFLPPDGATGDCASGDCASGDCASGFPDDAVRVVSEPMLNKAGRIRRLVCGARGRVPLSAKEGDPAASSSGFSGLRRGDVIRLVGPELREGGWGVAEGTSIEIVFRN